jgi:subtilase family serine protease
MRGRRTAVLVVAIASLAACTGTHPTDPSSSTSAVGAGGRGTPAAPFAAATPTRPSGVAAPPTTKDCLSQAGIRCYAPEQLARAYDLRPLWRSGWTGGGRTIAVVDSFGSPTIRQDLHTFDAAFGYPDPRLTIVQPAGRVPRFDPADSDQAGWAGEATLDVEWAHAMAPGADILLVETPVGETEGITGFPEIVTAEKYVLDRDLADVVSQSLGATEQTFTDAEQLRSQRSALEQAQSRAVTVLAASGDDGALARDLKARRTTSFGAEWPATDPLVTAVGGTRLTLDADGARTAPDAAWGGRGQSGASGGGLSTVFPRPAWQADVARVVGQARGVPDISMSAATDGGLLVWSTYAGGSRGWDVIGGTSASAPLFAAVVAIADQYAGRRLGLLNPALYALAAKDAAAAGILDVTTGSTAVGSQPGFAAGPGYDLASGLGTVDAAKLVRALATAASTSG